MPVHTEKQNISLGFFNNFKTNGFFQHIVFKNKSVPIRKGKICFLVFFTNTICENNVVVLFTYLTTLCGPGILMTYIET